MTFLVEVPHLPTIVPWVPHWRGLLWWPNCSLLLWSGRSVAVLLLLQLELLAVASELWRSARLSRGWHVNHAVLWGAPLELPPVRPGIVLFPFFSSTTSQAFIVPS
jgi:hypothetical protein